MIWLCLRQSVTVSTCDKSQITVATNDGSLKYPAWFMLQWDPHNSLYVWIERSHISPIQTIKDDNLFQRIHTVIDEAGPIHFTRFFLLEYLLCRQLCQSIYMIYIHKNIKCKFVPNQQKKAIKPSSSIWRTEYFASLFADLN